MFSFLSPSSKRMNNKMCGFNSKKGPNMLDSKLCSCSLFCHFELTKLWVISLKTYCEKQIKTQPKNNCNMFELFNRFHSSELGSYFVWRF